MGWSARVSAILLAVVLLLSTAKAQPVGTFTASVEADRVKVRILLYVYQNLTRFPNLTLSLEPRPEDNATVAFREAIRSLAPTAEILDPAIRLSVNAAWLNATVSFSVRGSSSVKGEVLLVDMGWKEFRVGEDLTLGNFSYNLYGRKHLRPVVEPYANLTEASLRLGKNITQVEFFRGAQNITLPAAANYFGNLTLFDLSALKEPIAEWRREYRPEGHLTVWTFPAVDVADFTVNVRFANSTTAHFVSSRLEASISVGGFATAQDNTIRVELASGVYEMAMAGIMLGLLALILASTFLARRVEKRPK